MRYTLFFAPTVFCLADALCGDEIAPRLMSRGPLGSAVQSHRPHKASPGKKQSAQETACIAMNTSRCD